MLPKRQQQAGGSASLHDGLVVEGSGMEAVIEAGPDDDLVQKPQNKRKRQHGMHTVPLVAAAAMARATGSSVYKSIFQRA